MERWGTRVGGSAYWRVGVGLPVLKAFGGARHNRGNADLRW